MSCTTQQCQLTDTNTHSYTQHSPRHSHSYAHFGLRCEFVLNSMHYAPRQRCNNVATTLRCSFSCQRKMRVIMHRLFVLTPSPLTFLEAIYKLSSQLVEQLEHASCSLRGHCKCLGLPILKTTQQKQMK